MEVYIVRGWHPYWHGGRGVVSETGTEAGWLAPQGTGTGTGAGWLAPGDVPHLTEPGTHVEGRSGAAGSKEAWRRPGFNRKLPS